MYLLITRGRRICRGTIGTASNTSCSLGTPASTSFRPVTASAAEKPTWNTHTEAVGVWLSAAGGHQPRSFTLAVRSRIQKVKTVGIFTMEKSSLYVSHTSFVSSTSFFFPLLGSRSLLKRPTSVVEIKKTIPQKNKKSGGNNRKRECHL